MSENLRPKILRPKYYRPKILAVNVSSFGDLRESSFPLQELSQPKKALARGIGTNIFPSCFKRSVLVDIGCLFIS